MDHGTPDAVEFREAQRLQWDSAALGWREWSKLIDRAASGISERLVDLARVQPGDRVLDVATGYGEPALSAARKAGPGGLVVATDISREMIAFGRERALEADLHNVEFIACDAASLDLPAAGFDAALSRWGIIFEPDAERIVGRIRTFLKPGGRMAISSWGSPDRVPYIAIPMGIAMQHLRIVAPTTGTPGPLSRTTPGALAGLLDGGGFSGVEVEEAEVTYEWRSPEEFIKYLKAIAPPLTSMIATEPLKVQAEIWAEITEAIRRFSEASGLVRLSNLVLLAVGRA